MPIKPVRQPRELPWRVGRKVGRTIYAQHGTEPSDQDELIGVMDTRELAQLVVEARDAKLSDPPKP